MAYTPIAIFPFKSGLSKYYKPFLIGNDAFVNLENCYSSRGSIVKREGSTVLARINDTGVSATSGWKISTGITNASPPVVTTSVAHGLSTGDMVFLENVLLTNGTIVTITAGATTVVQISGAVGATIAVGKTVYISGITGTMADVLNNKVFVISQIVGATLTLLVDTTGLTYTGGPGSVFLGALEKQAFQITVLSSTTFSLQILNANNATTNVPASGTATSANIYLPVVGTRTFILSSTGNEQLIVFNPKQAYLFNTTTDALDNISFLTSNDISTITPSVSPTTVTTTAAHLLTTGEIIIITGVTGTMSSVINDIPYAVTVVTATTFTIPVATNGLTYTAGGDIHFTWTGTKDDFFYTSNYARVMWTTNNVDNIRYYNGNSTGGWSNLRPVVSGSTIMTKTLLILPYKGHLVALNTLEGGTAFFNRARWSQVGTPFAGTLATVAISTVSIGASPITVTTSANHNLVAGQTVGIANIVGSAGSVLNNRVFTVLTTPTPTTFTIDAVTTGLTYTSGGFIQLMAVPATGFSTDVSAWRDDIPGKGGFIDADTSERIVSAEIIQDVMIVGFQFSTWRLTYTGNEVLPFIWERISTQFGCEGTFSTVPFDDGTMQISRRGIVKASYNDVVRSDMIIPDFVDNFETGLINEGLNRIQGIRDYQKRLVYWIYGDQAENNQTPNKILCFNYQDNTWSTFDQSFTTLGNYKKTTDNIWSTWTTPWQGDNSTWDTPLDQQNTILVVAGSKDGRVWSLMDPDSSTDNSVNYGFNITTNVINPFFEQGMRCRLAYYDLYVTSTAHGEVTVQNFTDDNPSNIWLEKTVSTNTPTNITKYVRVFLGMIARSHQITITMTPEQIEDDFIGSSDFEIQGIVLWVRPEGRIKQ